MALKARARRDIGGGDIILREGGREGGINTLNELGGERIDCAGGTGRRSPTFVVDLADRMRFILFILGHGML